MKPARKTKSVVELPIAPASVAAAQDATAVATVIGAVKMPESVP
jgi:hypothetical protein